MLNISACTIVKDEAQNISRWLDSVRPFADEIFVVDTGSQDNTREIVRKAGIKLYEFVWINDFAAAKNYALKQATGDWIVMLDADEYFTVDSQKRLRQVVSKYHPDKKIAGIITPFTNIDVHRHNEVISTSWQMRIFRNDPHLRFAGKVHESLQNQSGNERDFCVEKNLRFIHTGYSTVGMETKKKRNLDILLSDIEETGQETPQQMAYLLDCYLGLNDYQAALKYGRMAVAHLAEADLWGQEAKVLCSYLQAVEKTSPSAYPEELKKVREKYPHLPELWVLTGRQLLADKKMTAACGAYEKARQISRENVGKVGQHSAMESLTEEITNTLAHLERYFSYYAAMEKGDYRQGTAVAACSLQDFYERAGSLKRDLAYLFPRQKKTSIIIPHYNQRPYLEALIHSIREHTPQGEYEIILVDNASTDDSLTYLQGQRDIKVIANTENQGFPKACNQALKVANGSELLLLNNDIVVTPRWLTQLRRALYTAPKAGAVSPVTNNSSNFQQVTVPYTNELTVTALNDMTAFAEKYNNSDPAKWFKWGKLVAYCFLFKREVYAKIGGLDEVFSPGNYEDDDYSLRMRRAGYELYLCTDTFVHHFGSLSFRKRSQQQQEAYIKLNLRNRQKFLQKWQLSDSKYNFFSIYIQKLVLDKKECRIIEYESSCMLDLYLLAMNNPWGEISGTTKNKVDLDIGIPFKMFYAANLAEFLTVLNGYYDCIIVTEDFTDLSDKEAFIRRIEEHLFIGGLFMAANGQELLCLEKEV